MGEAMIRFTVLMALAWFGARIVIEQTQVELGTPHRAVTGLYFLWNSGALCICLLASSQGVVPHLGGFFARILFLSVSG